MWISSRGLEVIMSLTFLWAALLIFPTWKGPQIVLKVFFNLGCGHPEGRWGSPRRASPHISLPSKVRVGLCPFSGRSTVVDVGWYVEIEPLAYLAQNRQKKYYRLERTASRTILVLAKPSSLRVRGLSYEMGKC